MKLSPQLLEQTDPYGGFLVWTSYWRPNPNDPDPEMPGLKQAITAFVTLKPEERCMCGSGRPFEVCCRPKPLWEPVCYNPGAEGYSFLVPQEALFEQVKAPTLKERLDDDPRLAIVEDTPGGGFWILWGDPALESKYGIVCFGDIELRQDGSLLVTAMSDLRMQTVLELLQEIAADCLPDPPTLTKDPIPTLPKPPLPSAAPPKRRFSFSRRKPKS